MKDTVNINGLEARGLFCFSNDVFYSLMYGTYNGEMERIWIGEVDFLN